VRHREVSLPTNPWKRNCADALKHINILDAACAVVKRLFLPRVAAGAAPHCQLAVEDLLEQPLG
jgi:hypothetical protein